MRKDPDYEMERRPLGWWRRRNVRRRFARIRKKVPDLTKIINHTDDPSRVQDLELVFPEPITISYHPTKVNTFEEVTSHAIVWKLCEYNLHNKISKMIITSPQEVIDHTQSIADHTTPEIETVKIYAFWVNNKREKKNQAKQPKELAAPLEV